MTLVDKSLRVTRGSGPGCPGTGRRRNDKTTETKTEAKQEKTRKQTCERTSSSYNQLHDAMMPHVVFDFPGKEGWAWETRFGTLQKLMLPHVTTCKAYWASAWFVCCCFSFLCLCSFSGAAEHRWCSIGFGDRLWLHREAGLRESSEVQGYSDIHVYHVALRHYVRMIMFTRIRGLACPHQVVLFLKCVAESAF